ncbi:hypothetical protein CEUSTIGMA_g9089.t1 [Chlamydomonas eustigma]|uniref:Uncharacterized protein n=1 Tax=Chlamydomonas eustigma TaxID=1157962 RepID=A0A250XF20_9CHLO|nr:hypothetical protein CEUSTIGMA_g9089.t1 [Chlamydomonas eustigma]|eukprot:GAX81661.1 hypothetical protein CEUSTIGMA_g9089.t1 [Chlamydomonas eustigma]
MYGDFFGGDNVDEGNEDEGNEEDELEEDDEDDDQPDDTTDDQGLMHQAGDGERTSKPIENLSKATKQRMAADMSSHERRMARLQERIVELEKEAMADKGWQLRGEADASRRPLNSALELDLDFETTVKAAPQPTEEATADVEAMIKRRVVDHRFDDVIRVVPPPLETRTRTLELDDNKSKKGLGELYEDDFVKAAVGGSAADKDERVRLEAKAIFQALVSKLDALSHFHFAPKPVLEELAVRTDVAAVLMEEAAPVAVSAASMRLPTEVFKAQQEGAPKADGEMSREDRKRKRAQLKRSKKAERARKETERRDKAIALGGVAPVTGRRSAEDAALLAKAGKRARPLQGTESASTAAGKRSEFGKSTAVFGRLQELRDQAKAGAGPGNSKSSRLSDKEPGSVIASGSAFRL